MFCKQSLIQSEDEYGFVGEILENINLVVVLNLVAVVKYNATCFTRVEKRLFKQKYFTLFVDSKFSTQTVATRYTTTSLIRPAHFYGDFFLSRKKANVFPNKCTPLIRPPCQYDERTSFDVPNLGIRPLNMTNNAQLLSKIKQ